MPVSLIGTFGAMYLLGYSLDNLSLMALTISTGFVVDDAIVVLENVTRHIEAGMPRMQAALQGAREVGFTVLSMSLSLIAVFVPILLMGGIVGRLFREFAVTLVGGDHDLAGGLADDDADDVRLPAAPDRREQAHGRLYRASERAFDRDARTSTTARCAGALQWPAPGDAESCWRRVVPECLPLHASFRRASFPQQDTGRMIGGIQADQSISFQLMKQKLTQFVDIIRQDPAVAERRRLLPAAARPIPASCSSH